MSQPNNNADDQKTPSESQVDSKQKHGQGHHKARDKSKHGNSKRKSRSRSKSKRKHRRKLSNASIMSIDPFSLLQLKQSYQSKSDMNIVGNNNNDNNNNNNDGKNGKGGNLDPTSNSSQYDNDLNRAYQSLLNSSNANNKNNNNSNNNGKNNNNNNGSNDNINSNSLIETQKQQLLREMAEETIKISILQPKLDECAREYRELWEEKDAIEMELEQTNREKEIMKEQYEAKIEELLNKVSDLENLTEDRENQISENENILKLQHRDQLTLTSEQYQKELDKLEIQLKHKTSELEQAYAEMSTLRDTVELREHQNNQFEKQINEANKLNHRFKMLKTQYDAATKEIEDLKNDIFMLSAENQELKEHTNYLQDMIDQQQRTEPVNRPMSGKSFETEFIANDAKNKRGSIEMDKASNHSSLAAPFHLKNQHSQPGSAAGADLASEMNKMNIQHYDASEEQKVIDNKDVSSPIGTNTNANSNENDSETQSISNLSNNKDNNNNNNAIIPSVSAPGGDNDGAPTSWQEIQAGFNRKHSTVRGKNSQSKHSNSGPNAANNNNNTNNNNNDANAANNNNNNNGSNHVRSGQNIGTIDEFSMLSQYSSSETNIGDTLDEMSSDMKQMKEMLESLLDNERTTNQNGNTIENKRQLDRIYRAVRQLVILVGKDADTNMAYPSGGNNNQHNGNNQQLSDGKENDHSVYSDHSGGSGPSNDDSSNNGRSGSWLGWLFGDLGDSRANPTKKTLVQEYGPPLAFSSIIIAAAYLIIVYHRGYSIFGQPRVLRKK